MNQRYENTWFNHIEQLRRLSRDHYEHKNEIEGIIARLREIVKSNSETENETETYERGK